MLLFTLSPFFVWRHKCTDSPSYKQPHLSLSSFLSAVGTFRRGERKAISKRQIKPKKERKKSLRIYSSDWKVSVSLLWVLSSESGVPRGNCTIDQGNKQSDTLQEPQSFGFFLYTYFLPFLFVFFDLMHCSSLVPSIAQNLNWFKDIINDQQHLGSIRCVEWWYIFC